MSSDSPAQRHPAHRPTVTAQLSAAVAAVPLPALYPPPPAQTRQNLPHPATRAPAQDEPTPPLPQGVPNFQTNPPPLSHPIPVPAQTCHNPPEPATPPRAPAQNEPTTHPSPPHPLTPSSLSPLTPRQRHAARRLVAGHTATSIAALLGLNRHTISQWKKLPAFQLEIDLHLHTTNP